MTTITAPAEYTPTIEDGAWSMMACRNHPNLRWVRKNPEHLKGCISRNPQLMFRGSDESDQFHPFTPGLNGMKIRADESWETGDLQSRIDYVLELTAKGYVWECPCSVNDLYYIKE